MEQHNLYLIHKYNKLVLNVCTQLPTISSRQKS